MSIRYVIENIQNIIEGGYPEFGEIDYRSNENLHLYADVNKAKTLLNWQPKFTLNEGLLQTIQCLKK